MKRCEICGLETKNGKKICSGCNSIVEVKQKGRKAHRTSQEKAEKHLTKNPGLFIIPWNVFFKNK